MNFRFTILLLAILVVGGGIFAVFQASRSADPLALQPWLWKVGVDDIRHIQVAHDGQSVSFRQEGKQWVIEDGFDTPVFMERWGGITLALSGPRGDRTLSETIEDPGKYGLASPYASIVVTDRSGNVVEIQLGDPTPDQENQYVRLSDGRLSTIAKPWADVVAGLVTRPPYTPPWLETLGVAHIKAVGISLSGQEHLVAYYIADDQWIIFPGEGNDTGDRPVEAAAWDAMTRLFNDQSLAIVSQDLDDTAKYGLDSPHIVLDLETHTGDIVSFYIGGLTSGGDKRYMRQWEPRSLQLSTVDQDWVELLEKMATEPPMSS
jgi:hypothetical protein